jgi:hypothetical protein
LRLVLDADLLVALSAETGRARLSGKTALRPHRLFISPEIFARVEEALRQGDAPVRKASSAEGQLFNGRVMQNTVPCSGLLTKEAAPFR